MSYLVAPRTRVVHALPIHSLAGLHGGRGLGALDPFSAVMEIGGALVGGIFGNKAKSEELKTQRNMLQAQLNSADSQARLQAELGNRQLDAAVETARIQARNELAALDTQYAAELSSQRVKKQIAEDTLSAQLLASTQSGIFGLAQTGLTQATSMSMGYSKNAMMTLVLLVLGTATAVAIMRKPSSGKGQRKKRRKIGAGKMTYESSNFSERAGAAPMWSAA